MLEIILQHWNPLSKILIILIILITILGVVLSKSLKSYILDNWNYFKNKPYIIPFSGFINKNPNMTEMESTIHNFVNILWLTVKKILLLIMKPFYPFFNLIVKIIDHIKGILDNFRVQFKIMRNFLLKMIENIYKRLHDSVTAITYFFLKLREGLKKQIGLFKMLSWTVAHSYYFMYSLVKGPIGTFGKFGEKWGLAASVFTLGAPGAGTWYSSVCFDPTTKIVLKRGVIELQAVHIGDILLNNSIVLSVLTFNIETSIVPMFNYKNIIVSGDHVVIENNTPIRIKQSAYSKPILYNKNEVVCLVTNTGLIHIDNIIFHDYLDTHNVPINHQIHSIVENHLNNTPFALSETIRDNDLLWGFSKDTIIEYKNSFMSLKDIKIGDVCLGSRVTGIINISKNSITHYEYRCNNGLKIYVSGNQLVLEKGTWLRISQSKYSKKIDTLNSDYISFVTDTHLVDINNTLFRDFIETNNIEVITKINQIVDENI
uniref:Vint domain-containing protein n=1 Tax=viral metagenome TaxID=1070528 RepID=A0A6C0EIA7_9ZZZZ